MIDVNTSSPAVLAFQSIVTVAGIATIHAFVIGGILRKKTDPYVGKTNKRQSHDGFTNGIAAEDSKEEEEANDQYVTFCMQIVSSLQMLLLRMNSQGHLLHNVLAHSHTLWLRNFFLCYHTTFSYTIANRQ
jgi:hypothetical protein